MTLAEIMRHSETDAYLNLGPPAPDPGWIYRDFYPMPQHQWTDLLAIIGPGNAKLVAANTKQLPPAEMCRAQLWISPAGQARWSAYLKAGEPYHLVSGAKAESFLPPEEVANE